MAGIKKQTKRSLRPKADFPNPPVYKTRNIRWLKIRFAPVALTKRQKNSQLWHTVKEAADLFGVSKCTIRLAAYRGQFDVGQYDGKIYVKVPPKFRKADTGGQKIVQISGKSAPVPSGRKLHGR